MTLHYILVLIVSIISIWAYTKFWFFFFFSPKIAGKFLFTPVQQVIQLFLIYSFNFLSHTVRDMIDEFISYTFVFSVGGLLNATCGNATELIIAIFALAQHKIAVVKYSLLGSILSNLLLVLGTSLFCGGIANIRREQKYDRVSS